MQMYSESVTITRVQKSFFLLVSILLTPQHDLFAASGTRTGWHGIKT